jgi:hypothetical protein
MIKIKILKHKIKKWLVFNDIDLIGSLLLMFTLISTAAYSIIVELK